MTDRKRTSAKVKAKREAASAPDSAEAVERGRGLEERFSDRLEITLPVRHNQRLAKILELVNADDDLYALWVAANVNAIERLGMSDHGPVHVKIVANIAIKMLRMLLQAGIEPGIARHYAMAAEDAEVVVALAALLHDLGMSIHRTDHEEYSLFLADGKLREILAGLYDRREAAIVRSEALHAIIAHRAGGRPLTLEAGVVRIADALDMAKGRSRIPFEAGAVTIHSVSAAAIEAVHIEAGEERPVRVRVEMSNSAGIFQLDELLRKKLAGSGLEEYVELEANVVCDTEKRLLQRFRI